jgi:hypothetical protein
MVTRLRLPARSATMLHELCLSAPVFLLSSWRRRWRRESDSWTSPRTVSLVLFARQNGADV